MTAHNHIVCVEWSKSVDAVDLLRRSSTAALAIGGALRLWAGY